MNPTGVNTYLMPRGADSLRATDGIPETPLSFEQKVMALKRKVDDVVSRDLSMQAAIAKGDVYGRCGTFSHKLEKKLLPEGVETRVTTSPDSDTSGHAYLTTQIDGVEVIIEPTIGQFIQGHWEVFVGTRERLRTLVLDPMTKIINTRSRNNPPEAFRRIWGETGLVYPKASQA